MPRKIFDTQEAKHQGSKTPYNWLLKVGWDDKYYALSEEYLKQYFEDGDWRLPDDEDTWIVDALPLLENNIKDRYYQLHVMKDGFLHFKDKPVRRPLQIELWRYKSKNEVVAKLQKNPKILKVRLEDIPSYNRDGSELRRIHITYLPSVQEFNRLVVCAKREDSFDRHYDIEERLGIKKFKIPY